MKQHDSQRLANLFAAVQSDAERLVMLADEERRLHERLEEVSREKAFVVADLADSARAAALADVRQSLARAKRRRPVTT